MKGWYEPLQQALSLTLHACAFRRFVRHIHQTGRFAELGILIGFQQLGRVTEQFSNQFLGFLVKFFQAAGWTALAKIGSQIG